MGGGHPRLLHSQHSSDPLPHRQPFAPSRAAQVKLESGLNSLLQVCPRVLEEILGGTVNFPGPSTVASTDHKGMWEPKLAEGRGPARMGQAKSTLWPRWC